MDSENIFSFLKGIAEHNDRDWFYAHRDRYIAARKSFEEGIDQLIVKLSAFDPEIKYLTARDCCYRFYRDIRFSQDKSPYKRHFGAYICSRGKKSIRGGYYIHMQPGKSLLAFGCYFLPTPILTQCRKEILDDIDTWKEAVESKAFIRNFGLPDKGYWDEENISPKGFGLASLKTAPKGFPKNSEYMQYLRMKDYICWKRVEESIFSQADWIKETIRLARIAKPSMDFINSVIDDYI